MDEWLNGWIDGCTQQGPVVNILDTNGTERHLAQARAATNTRIPLMFDKLGGITRAVGPMYASGAVFATVSVRAPFAPIVEQLASKAIRDAFLHPEDP